MHIKLSKYLILFTLLFTLIPAHAEQRKTFIQTKSTTFYVSSFNGTINDDSTMIMGGRAPDLHYYSIIQFDISSLPKEVTIDSALLELYCEEVFIHPTIDGQLCFERINQSWEKSKITLNNPVQSSAADVINAPWPAVDKKLPIDITPFVQGWHNKIFPNYGIKGFARTSNDFPNSYAIFTSANLVPTLSIHKAKLNNVPKLTITYH